VVCSALVSTSAVILRPEQIRNKILDRKKNILRAAGRFDPGRPIEEQFSRFEIRVVDLESGEYREDIAAATFDQRKAARSDDLGVAVPEDEDIAGLKRRSRVAPVYLAKNEAGELEQLILPVHGKGLWSTLYGYLALESDLATIAGFSIYDHGETPGLGGEVDNPRWKKQWVGKRAFDEEGDVEIEVVKGAADRGDPHQIDGLSGATITTRGVDALLRYWLGKNGFRPFLDRLRSTKGENENG
jgi:Na+-transporting NADH:ubiquinone oxidoreductase subunit C